MCMVKCGGALSCQCLPLLAQSSGPKKKKGVKDHIPYRDSVLTWILKENLGEEFGSSSVL